MVMVVSLAIAGGACGGDDDGGAADDASATSDASDTGGDSDSGGAWCELARDIDSDDTLFDSMDINDPDSVENAYQEFVNVFEDAADNAPDEIKADMEIVLERIKTAFEALKDADFNIVEVDQAVFEDPEADAASDRIDAYNEEVCGIESDADVTDDTAVTEDTGTDDGATVSIPGTIQDMLMSQFVLAGMTEEQATCMVENLDMEDVAANGAADLSMFIELFETCGIDPSKLAPGG
jgi:hypothetical protein